MKKLRYTFLTMVALMALAISCEDEELNPYVEPEGNAHALGQFVSLADGSTLIPLATQFYSQSAVDAAVFFDQANQNQGINYKLQWVSIDNRVTISQIELYLEFNETYSDADRNPLIARHGGASKGPSYPAGKLWRTITAPAMRTPVDITITPNDVYELFKDNTFDYTKDNVSNPTPVFGVPGTGQFRRNRSVAGSRFFSTTGITVGTGTIELSADQFRIRWRLIGSDGTAYGSWSNSVCAETVGVNCTGQWRVNSQVFNPRVTVARETNAKSILRAGDVTTFTLTYNRQIATPPTVSLVAPSSSVPAPPSLGTLGTLTPVSGTNNRFTITYTAPSGYSGGVTVRIAGAVSGGSGSTAGLTQVTSNQSLTVDNDAPTTVSGILFNGSTTGRVGRGQSLTISLTFNEAMSSASANALKVTIEGQNLDKIDAANMTLASDGLSASYLYLWRDGSTPFDNTHGNVSVTISGGKDVTGNSFGGATGSFVNDVGVPGSFNPGTGVVNVDATVPGPSMSVAAGYDLGTQLRWTITQTAGLTPAESRSGTWFWIALRGTDSNNDGDFNDAGVDANGDGDFTDVGDTAPDVAPTPPGQATRTVTGLANVVYNGFITTGFTNVAATGSTTSSGENFTAFMPNGTFHIYAYFVSSTGNVSANSGPLLIQMTGD